MVKVISFEGFERVSHFFVVGTAAVRPSPIFSSRETMLVGDGLSWSRVIVKQHWSD